MTIRNLSLIVSFLLVSQPGALAKLRYWDLLIHNGDTFAIHSDPLDELSNFKELHPLFFEDSIDYLPHRYGEKTGCQPYDWRNYYAEWILIDSQLFLSGIY